MKSDEIMKSPVGSIANALSGKIPGLSSVQSSGQPGADDATIYVRGVGSLTEGLSAPLMLVDGVERSFYQLDPNEIEDITVLKDASATAVFGVRGANGVVLVTTKRGQKAKLKSVFLPVWHFSCLPVYRNLPIVMIMQQLTIMLSCVME
jgi:TonB-dependent SusC/RagA subfamily outer membrane receptor